MDITVFHEVVDKVSIEGHSSEGLTGAGGYTSKVASLWLACGRCWLVEGCSTFPRRPLHRLLEASVAGFLRRDEYPAELYRVEESSLRGSLARWGLQTKACFWESGLAHLFTYTLNLEPCSPDDLWFPKPAIPSEGNAFWRLGEHKQADLQCGVKKTEEALSHRGIWMEIAGYDSLREHLQHLLQDPVKSSRAFTGRSVIVHGKEPTRACSYDELSHRIPWNSS
ncbi:uncharacterized protein LOC125168121 [Prionailurus viverrinus]|uniref:uncharacterized protein LOC125168121 n=1 Tax=Prionailurus viverrinus TaxID=61388 RepID=UPI001FF1F5B0|nr:uncharacterized protein LOC125168121 [Prionailurus viverrinus]